ncbi:hypothetical protein Ae201684P_019250 [Aphanomyces euteiches]|uniref:Uncharacterized protein n=1 Tax=Aphanomyces euteiches TaxID=100861 RepID=A0A6G0WDG6_9STRA|nr:hypothetical protein Ae201684_016030 [Aphanomyces euteiches]KAH9078152.1 hypothetical protein Ae201684P_019250 [Aphanomyces euteiches]KAH9133553.1 hypothetical protein AeRB84_020392 [Aphanomyces euteiches]
MRASSVHGGTEKGQPSLVRILSRTPGDCRLAASLSLFFCVIVGWMAFWNLASTTTMSATATMTHHLRRLDLFGDSNAKIYFIVGVSAMIALLIAFAVVQERRNNYSLRQLRDSTADTVIDLEIETPKSPV